MVERDTKGKSRAGVFLVYLPSQHILSVLAIIIFILTSCSTQYPETCPSRNHIGLENADGIAGDDSLPFRFPLDLSPYDNQIPQSWFGRSNECTPDVEGGCNEYAERKFHAAEDYKFPVGTRVYAMADGIIRYSGKAGGYGWLILIDHPQANLYSLYGHLSPSRWSLKDDTVVKRGDLIAYLGDTDENGGSRKQPLLTHLHFGIRTGQVADYPAKGEWRYMAGWIKPCPQDIGWLQPSLVITNQEIPPGGYSQPKVGFFTRWTFEIVYSILFLASGTFLVIRLSKQKSRVLLLLPGTFMIVAGIVSSNKRLVRDIVIPVIGIFILAFGFYYFLRHSTPNSNA